MVVRRKLAPGVLSSAGAESLSNSREMRVHPSPKTPAGCRAGQRQWEQGGVVGQCGEGVTIEGWCLIWQAQAWEAGWPA